VVGSENPARNGRETGAASPTLHTILDDVRAEVLLPLSAGSRLVGAVAICGKDDDEPYTSEELETLAAIGHYAAISIVNIQLIETLKQQLEALTFEKERTAQLAQDVYKAGSRERAQVSREIHDTVLQDLTLASRLLYNVRDDLTDMLDQVAGLQEQEAGASLNRQAAQQAAASAALQLCEEWLEGLLRAPEPSAQAGSMSSLPEPQLKMAMDNVRKASGQLRDLCAKLRPNYLDFSLSHLVKWTVEEAQAGCSIPIALTVRGSEPDALPDNLKDALHKVAKVSLANAANHSHATSITTDLELSHKAITLTITDNGCGFELADLKEYQAGSRFGLVDIYEHAFMLGGEVTLETAPGKGTTMRFCVPVYAVAPAAVAAPASHGG